MTVRGVEEFKISDSLNVIIKPDSSVITLLQNSDIKFNGKITPVISRSTVRISC